MISGVNMVFLIGLLLAVILVGSTAYLCYNWGYQDGVKSGSWESVLARAERVNKAAVGKGSNLNL